MDARTRRAPSAARHALQWALIAWLLPGTALLPARAQGGPHVLTLPARQFSLGDVEEQKDAYGDFIVVKSVVEYDLAVAGE